MEQVIFKLKNKIWEREVGIDDYGNIPIRIMSHEEHLDEALVVVADEVISRVNILRNESVEYAMESRYRDDIEESGDLFIQSIHVVNKTQFDIWFTLGFTGRYLAVKYKEGVMYEVYCDAP